LRRDIQFLRGLAVLVVVLYHSNLGFLDQGYLGVDVFFVLSGFLITSVILKKVDKGTFYFSEFYLRRAKRLLPALYSTLIFTTILAIGVLTQQQWEDYIAQLISAITFTANMVLPTQSGYFESAAEGKPLLHIWSLSLEEQYYFLLPMMLVFIPKKHQLTGIICLTVVSMLWCFSWVYSNSADTRLLWRIAEIPPSEWAFYLLPTRAWELLGGSLCAWLVLNKPLLIHTNFVKLTSLVAILLICFVDIESNHPSLESLIVVVATMLILLGKDNWLPKHKSIQVIEKVGDWSYSIYLVHWPLFALSYVGFVGDVPTNIKVLLTVASIGLGYLQFQYVETPFREGRQQYLFSNWKIAVSITLILLSFSIALGYKTNNLEPEIAEIRRTNYGLSKICNGIKSISPKLNDSCATSEQPDTIVWGDSYAMHLVPGVSATNNNIAQFTKSECGPIIDLATIDSRYSLAWAEKCVAFNRGVFDYLKSNDHVKFAILSSTLGTYLNFEKSEYLTSSGVQQAEHQLLKDAFRDTLLAIKALGITPIVVSPPPKSGFNVGECLERLYGQAWLFRNDCNIDLKAYEKNQMLVNETLKSIEEVAEVIWLRDYLCDPISCNTSIENTMLYRDGGHLTIDGSVKLWQKIKLE
jgi:peptidoglycan/LPS O-acetylase OafA/YrhL